MTVVGRWPALPVAVALALLAGVTPGASQDTEGTTQTGRFTIRVSEPTQKGVWPGTWYYTNRSARMALWIRNDENGLPEFKFRYQSRGTPEAFETGWDSKASYELAGYPGSFSFEVVERDEFAARAKWRWEVEFPNAKKIETADVKLYRAADGRKIVFLFEGIERRVQKEDGERVSRAPLSWSFHKASKRLVLWDELPF